MAYYFGSLVITNGLSTMIKHLTKSGLFCAGAIAILILFTASKSFAQSQLGGQVFEDKTTMPIIGVGVENLNSHAKAATAKDGTFIITAKVGETLLFTSTFYEPDTVYIADLKFLKIGLRLKNTSLKEVKVQNAEVKLNNTVYHAPGLFNSPTVLYQTDADGRPIGGIKIMIHDSKSGEKKRLHQQQVSVDEQNKEAIVQMFSPDNLKNYVPINGQEMTNFIILYTPDLKIFKDKGFNFLAYVADSYKRFKDIPLAQRQSPNFTKLTASATPTH